MNIERGESSKKQNRIKINKRKLLDLLSFPLSVVAIFLTVLLLTEAFSSEDGPMTSSSSLELRPDLIQMLPVFEAVCNELGLDYQEVLMSGDLATQLFLTSDQPHEIVLPDPASAEYFSSSTDTVVDIGVDDSFDFYSSLATILEAQGSTTFTGSIEEQPLPIIIYPDVESRPDVGSGQGITISCSES